MASALDSPNVHSAVAATRHLLDASFATLTGQERAAFCFMLRGLVEGVSLGIGLEALSEADEAREMARYGALVEVAA